MSTTPRWQRECACCGKETIALAMVSDPFQDSCYGVCRDCLAPLYEKQMEMLRAVFAAREAE